MQARNVFPNREPFSESDFPAIFGSGLARAVAAFDLDRLARRIGATTKTLTNAMRGKGVMRADLAFNAVQASPASFSELFARMGFDPCPTDTADAPDAEALAQLAQFMAAYATAVADGKRDHRETRELAKLIRPMLPWLRGIVKQADA